nr:reverse transcriptase domain-containing protein [Tanacetum cinerariifolium]
MIKEHDQQAKMKATPRKLAYVDSDKEAPAESLVRGFSDRFSLESSSTSNTHKQTRAASIIRMTPSKNKEPIHLRRSRRLENRSITKEKARKERSKPKGKRSEHQETSSDSEHEEAKKLNDKIPKTIDKMFKRVRAFIREEVATGSAEMACPYQGDKGYILKKAIEEALASGKLSHLVKDIHQNNQQSRNQRRNGIKIINMIMEGGNRKRPFEEGRSGLTDELTFPAIPCNQMTNEPIILEGIIKGNQVRRILVDGRSSLEIMYEHYFRDLNVNIRLRLRRCKASMVERTKMRSLRAVGSTIPSIIKFPTNQGTLTMETSREALWECKQLERVKGSQKELGDEGLSSRGIKLNSTFITAEYPNIPKRRKTKEGLVDSQPMEEEFQGAMTRDEGTETHTGPTEPQAKIKATPRKLSYADSDKEDPTRSLAKGFFDRFSLESSGTSDTHRKTRSTSKSQKTPSKNKEPTHLNRLRRLEDRSTTIEKARSKSIEKRSRHQEISSDSEHEEGSKDTYEDLNSSYKRSKPTPFTQRITRFKYHWRAKLPWNIIVYEGYKDPEDHLERVRAFIKGEMATQSTEMVRPCQGDKGYVRLAWYGVPKKPKIGVAQEKHEEIWGIREQAILRARSNFGRGPSSGLSSLEKTRSKEDVEEVFTISRERPDQGRGRARIFNGISIQMFPPTSKRI